MKIVKALVAALVVAIGLHIAAKVVQRSKPVAIKAKPSVQQLASHQITIIDSHYLPDARCTATAVGPHALLTAEHCNDSPDPDDTLLIDFSLRKFNIQGTIKDGRDHVIYLVDGPAFRNYVLINPVFESNEPVGSPVYMYGCGGGIFPCRKLSGFRMPWNDGSDVDENDGIGQYSLEVVHGDSGSAIFNTFGFPVAVVTYAYGENGWKSWFTRDTCIAFGMNFTEPQLKAMREFIPSSESLKKAAVPESPLSLLNLFR